MGARQSKRSVDITTTPKKGDNETAAISEDKIEKLGDADVEVVKNGTAAHTDIEFVDKDDTKEAKESDTTEVKENGLPDSSDGEKTPDKEAATPAAGDQPATAESIVEKNSENGDKAAETPDSKKPKDKKKKKWSLRSISFSKKDKSKPGKDKEKNGEVEDVNEEKEEETAKTPTEAVKTEDESKEVEGAQTDLTTKDANIEQVVVKTPEVEEPRTEAKVEAVVAPIEQSTVEATKEEESQKPVETEECTKPEKVEEKTTITPSEEVKEVRNEELPPPLPNSNPPSQVAVFAESLKDDSILINEKTPSPLIESQCRPENEPAVIPVEAPLDVKHPELKDEPVIDASEPVNIIQSHIATDIPVIESCPQVSEPPYESPPEIQLVIPLEGASEGGSSEELPDTSTVIPGSEVVNPAENESISSKNDPVELSDSKEKYVPKPSEHGNVDIPSTGDSSPFVIETLPKLIEATVLDTSSITSVVTNDSPLILSTQESETSNLAEAESKLKFEIEENPSADSITSVPIIIEEKLPVVSSAGDVPNPLDSQTSFEDTDESILQELKSNLNLKESSISQESNQSEEQSLDLSTIPEVLESSDLKLTEESISTPEISASIVNVELAEPTNIVIESQQDEKNSTKVETLCNADSLADLSTESLPSLPEPTDSVLEPMSLPPLDFLPDPLVDDNLPVESLVTKPNETEPEVVLTNGNATNGLKSSPTADDGDTPPPPPPDGPLKQQVIAPEPSVGACEISQSSEVKTNIVESAQSEAQ